jgi:transcriptional regulator with XRE-family HTH domain
MTGLGRCIRLIRRGLGESQEIFARRIGVDQTTVSQYENGRVVPSKEVISRIYASAHGDRQQQKFLRGVLGKHVAGNMMAAEAFLDRQEVLQFLISRVPRESTGGRNVNARFAELTADLISDDDLDDSINQVLELWRLLGTPETAWVFAKAAAYIESELNMMAVLGDRRPKSNKPAT